MKFCGTSFSENFENFFSVSFMLAQTIGLTFAILYQHRIPLIKRIYVPLSVYAIVFLFTTLFVVIKMPANTLFFITLLCAFLCGLCGSVLSGGLFGYAAVFPPQYTGALMSGQGLGGVTVSAASLFTIWASKRVDYCSDDDGGECEYSTDYSALTFFLLATIILVSCIVAFGVLEALPFSKYVCVVSIWVLFQIMFCHFRFYHERSLAVIDDTAVAILEDDLNDRLIKTEIDSSQESASDAVSFSEIKRIFNLIKTPALSVWFTFVVTIGLFPSITVLIESEDKCSSSSRFSNDLFVPFMFLLFNVFDLVGRLLAQHVKLFTEKNIWIPVVLRVIYFPLFLLCNVSGSQFKAVFVSDAWPIIFMITFSLSNGYLASLCMMLSPQLVKSTDMQLTGTMMIFFLTVGLFGGAGVSFISLLVSNGEV
jgi:equilibrative nucleoside transporter 1/2/3